MSVVASMVAFLLNEQDIEDEVDDRIFVQYVKDNTPYPYLLLRTVNDTPFYSQDGEGLNETILQIEAYSDVLSEAHGLNGIVKGLLSGYKGDIGDHRGYVFARETQDQWMTDGRHFKVFSQYIVRTL